MTTTARRYGRLADVRIQPTLQAEELLSSYEVARRYQVSQRTVLAWAKKQWIPSIFTPGGHRRYPADQLDQAVAAIRERLGR